MSLISLLYAIDIEPASEWQDVFENYAPLIRLSRIENGRSPQTTPRAGPLHSGRSDSSSGAASGGGVSSGDDEAAHVSPSSSPLGVPQEVAKYLELTAPVTVTIPPAHSDEELEMYHAYVQQYLAEEEAEKAYIAFIFDEYCKRKSLEQKEQGEVERYLENLAEARRRDLPPHVRNLLGIIVDNEAKEREEVYVAYDGFLKWIDETTPLWLEAVHKREEENQRQAEAKRAALAAAKAALAEELARGRELGPAPTALTGDGSRPSLHSAPVPPIGADGTLNYTPSFSFDTVIPVDVDEEPKTPAELSESQLRKKAILMLEREEEEMKRRREEQLERLKAQEDAIRANLEAKARQKAEEEARQREDVLAQRYQSLLEQESALQGRLQQKEAQRRREEEERKMMLEHIAAEEELLRRRLQEQEDRRKAAEEERQRLERKKKEELYEHIRAEEEVIRRRIEQREAERLAEQQRQTAAAEEARRQQRIHEEQEEALRRANEARFREEKERQLRYLQEQEEAVKARVRAKELAELQQRELQRQREMGALPSTGPSYFAPGTYYDPYRSPAPPGPALPAAAGYYPPYPYQAPPPPPAPQPYAVAPMYPPPPSAPAPHAYYPYGTQQPPPPRW